ncbi:hypothetical protein [Microvirga sp. VF16]|uniref:hypothetical protein n=1 Tax=Microvirga sp. VF16 TaxID=2807101 RepID=UPI00193CC54A|nr:hypothetical protein [Microvirga sp. VF16]QRM34834.1 hypothetical protein JO965_41985 [Microvirga sp. VF16]
MNIWLTHFVLSSLISVAHPIAALANGASFGSVAPDTVPQPRSSKAVISFVSPPTLFPIEGFAFKTAYRPLPVYDRPGGSSVGELTMTNANCAGVEDSPACHQVGPWVLQFTNGTQYSVEVGEYGYSAYGLVSYSQSTLGPNGLWSEISSEMGPLWVLTPAEAVIPYESLVHVVDNFDRWCDQPGSCTPVQQDMRAEVRRVAEGQYKLLSCYLHAYEVTGMTTADRATYYRVNLAEVEPGSGVPHLPRSGFVPTRNLNGSHTGTFYSRGC